MFWQQLLAIAITVFLIWLVYRQIHRNPQAFSKANFIKSMGTLGMLALALIAFIAFCVLLLRNS